MTNPTVALATRPLELDTRSSRANKVENAAEQFEGLLLHQLLKSASGDEGGWLGTGEEDSAGLQAMNLAQEQFASAMAARGGLGLAKTVAPTLMAQASGQSVNIHQD